MFHRKTLSSLAVALLAAVALAPAAASAMPADPTGHTQAQVAVNPVTKEPVGPEPRDGESLAPRARHPRSLGLWPAPSQPTAGAQSQPAGDTDDGFQVVLIAIGAALLLAGLAVTAMQVRTRTAH